MKLAKIIGFSLFIIMVVCFIVILITDGHLTAVRIWLISLGILILFFGIIYRSSIHEEMYYTNSSNDILSTILLGILEFLHWKVVKFIFISLGLCVIVSIFFV